jgi:hypothetical protein
MASYSPLSRDLRIAMLQFVILPAVLYNIEVSIHVILCCLFGDVVSYPDCTMSSRIISE